MITCLGKSCSFGSPCMSSVNVCQSVCVLLSLLILMVGCGWLSLVMSLIVSYFVLSFIAQDTLDGIWD